MEGAMLPTRRSEKTHRRTKRTQCYAMGNLGCKKDKKACFNGSVLCTFVFWWKIISTISTVLCTLKLAAEQQTIGRNNWVNRLPKVHSTEPIKHLSFSAGSKHSITTNKKNRTTSILLSIWFFYL